MHSAETRKYFNYFEMSLMFLATSYLRVVCYPS